jgi:hypothetical protein
VARPHPIAVSRHARVTVKVISRRLVAAHGKFVVMGPVRTRLRLLAVLWLSCQAAGFLGAPVALALTLHAAAEESCACPGGDHRTCPMHHGQGAGDGAARHGCVFQNASTPGDAALLSLVGAAGVLPQVEGAAAPAGPEPVARPVFSIQFRSDLPDLPPPRG